MGVDVSGRKPKIETGDYFGANWWGWRPIQALSETAIELKGLGFDTTNWGSNDGKGLKNQRECNKLADAIELLISEKYGENLTEDEDRLYVCMGMWCEAGTGKFIPREVTKALDDQYEYGDILFTSVVALDGSLVEPSYSVSLGRLKQWINFLRNCGGFQIW